MTSALRYFPVEPLLLICGVAGVVVVGVFARTARSGGPRRAVAVTSRVALVGVVLAVLAVTLTGGAAGGSGINLVPGVEITREMNNVDTGLGVVNILGNVLMFVPVSALVVVAFKVGWWRATAGGAVLSLCVELSQLALGRSADIDDLLLNTCGAALGAAAALLGLVVARWKAHSRAAG